ncbi:biotin--[acetyl-CoA-carboxylase] ligase [Antarcticibacterium flavum]|uniref:Biotin--[acetyl-CoA-carboxylase] ligase n=1 Tax=Antarcticibacterium flavum TaxID=2058175 RepID=A0A5B7X4X8_9FLAO|nr:MULTISPECIES: biotin--[acetyl-CoA-carboxylase] ligase [Antarcticibacterium]MCM4160000.1 biotin--[acetyl-CoA-carboxylase] ligase [Antarcticibacterium sp. W02-3]QCY70409.1 biotin--[acetyl-CoA-carboxylase] ligase [Antarcticibacterium flavum]
MRIIKVSATESTNNFAREWFAANKETSPVVITAVEQTRGRGQRGAGWDSNAGENLTFSIIYPSPGVEVPGQFLISVGVGLAIINVLNSFNINKLSLKWPNDIMAANFKIGGILIENILSGGRIAACIIGVGLNVNQQHFPGLPKASSLRNTTGIDFNLDRVLSLIISEVEKTMKNIGELPAEVILRQYEQVLFRKDKISTFELPSGDLLTGIIKGISPTGLLTVQVEDNIIKKFDLKELKLLF